MRRWARFRKQYEASSTQPDQAPVLPRRLSLLLFAGRSLPPIREESGERTSMTASCHGREHLWEQDEKQSMIDAGTNNNNTVQYGDSCATQFPAHVKGTDGLFYGKRRPLRSACRRRCHVEWKTCPTSTRLSMQYTLPSCTVTYMQY
jgi:hypothetical protein